MNTVCNWQEKVSFVASFGQHQVPMDTKAPIGSDNAASPKQLVLAAICGCTGMDVVSLLRKGKQQPKAFAITAHADLTDGHPATFKQVHLVYKVDGDVTSELIVDAVTKSMTIYCGVSAMIAKACTISYDIELNHVRVGSGEAKFPG